MPNAHLSMPVDQNSRADTETDFLIEHSIQVIQFFSRPLPKAGRELQTELNTTNGGMREDEGGGPIANKYAIHAYTHGPVTGSGFLTPTLQCS